MKKPTTSFPEQIFYLLDTALHFASLIYFYYLAILHDNIYFIFISALNEYKLGLIAHEGCHLAINKNYGMLYDIMLGSSAQWSK